MIFRRRAYDRAAHQVDVHRYASDAGNAIILIKNVILHNKWAGGAVGLWIMGLLIVFVLPAPIAVTDAQLASYKAKAKLAERFNGPLVEASKDMRVAEDRYLTDRVCITALTTQANSMSQFVRPWTVAKEVLVKDHLCTYAMILFNSLRNGSCTGYLLYPSNAKLVLIPCCCSYALSPPKPRSLESKM
jgi:hypothetical protein